MAAEDSDRVDEGAASELGKPWVSGREGRRGKDGPDGCGEQNKKEDRGTHTTEPLNETGEIMLLRDLAATPGLIISAPARLQLI
jgi:hypothetical protein